MMPPSWFWGDMAGLAPLYPPVDRKWVVVDKMYKLLHLVEMDGDTLHASDIKGQEIVMVYYVLIMSWYSLFPLRWLAFAFNQSSAAAWNNGR